MFAHTKLSTSLRIRHKCEIRSWVGYGRIRYKFKGGLRGVVNYIGYAEIARGLFQGAAINHLRLRIEAVCGWGGGGIALIVATAPVTCHPPSIPNRLNFGILWVVIPILRVVLVRTICPSEGGLANPAPDA